MEFKELVKERYSVRKFKPEAVEKETLDKILAVGNLAPTAKNIQPHRIYVIQGEENLAHLSKLTHCGFGAGTVLLFTYNTDEEWKNPLEDGISSGIEDVSIVATHIMLAAKDFGLDTCWCNYFKNSEIEKVFGIPENEKSVLLMPIGYADESASPSSMHEAKKDISEIVKYI